MRKALPKLFLSVAVLFLSSFLFATKVHAAPCQDLGVNVAGNWHRANLEKIRQEANCSGPMPITVAIVPEIANNPQAIENIQKDLKDLNFEPTWRLWGEGAPKSQEEINRWLNVAKQIDTGRIQLFNEPNLCNKGCFGSGSSTPEEDARIIQQFLTARQAGQITVPVGNAPLAHTETNTGQVIPHREYWRRFNDACNGCVQNFDVIVSNIYAPVKLDRNTSVGQAVDKFAEEWVREIDFLTSSRGLGLNLSGKSFVIAEAGLAPGNYGTNTGSSFNARREHMRLFADALEEKLKKDPSFLANKFRQITNRGLPPGTTIDQISFFLSDDLGNQWLMIRRCDSNGECGWSWSRYSVYGPGGGKCPPDAECITARPTRALGDIIEIQHKVKLEKEQETGTDPIKLKSQVAPDLLTQGSIGPRGGLWFTRLSTYLDRIFSSVPHLLPAKQVKELEFPPESALEIRVNHPGCESNDYQYRFQEGSGPTEADTTPEVPTMLFGSRLSGAIVGSQPSSKVKGVVEPAPLPEFREEIDCEDPQGEGLAQAVPVNARGKTEFNLSFGETVQRKISQALKTLEEAAVSFFDQAKQLARFPANFTEERTVEEATVRIQVESWTPGAEQLAEWTQGQIGFWWALVPRGKQVPVADARNPVPYEVPKGSDKNNLGVAIDGQGNLDEAFTTFESAIYPANKLLTQTEKGALQTFPGAYAKLAPDVNENNGEINTNVAHEYFELVDVNTDTLKHEPLPIKGFQSLSDAQKEAMIKTVLSSWPNSSIQDNFNKVYNAAKENNINPVFLIAIWVEESGAGHAKQARSDFGCFPGGNTSLVLSFERSLNCVVGHINQHGSSYENWLRWFCGPTAVPICSNGGNEATVINLKFWYEKLERGVSGAGKQDI